MKISRALKTVSMNRNHGTGVGRNKMKKMLWGQMAGNSWRWVMILAAMMMAWSGCSGSSGGDNEQAPSGSFSAKATLAPRTGGAVSVDIGDGSTVVLEIPEGALAKSTLVTLTVTPEGSLEVPAKAKSAKATVHTRLSISIKPALDLLEPASLSIVFPENAGFVDRYLAQERAEVSSIPPKQGFLDNALKASIYRLGEFYCSQPDIEDMIVSAYRLLEESPEGCWQDAYILFDALLYFSARLGENGKLLESQECFERVAELCRQSALAFLASAGPVGVEKNDALLNALKKYRNLMMLCENPENIVKSFDDRLLIPDSR